MNAPSQQAVGAAVAVLTAMEQASDKVTVLAHYLEHSEAVRTAALKVQSQNERLRSALSVIERECKTLQGGAIAKAEPFSQAIFATIGTLCTVTLGAP